MTGRYRVEIGRRAQRSLRALERRDQQRVRAAIDLLADNPRPPRRVGVVGEPNTSRVLVGVYRIVYDILDERLVIQMVRVGHRFHGGLMPDPPVPARTRPVLKLFGFGVSFVSRSEARRLLDGLDDFTEVDVDFAGVEDVGQGFVEEMLRVGPTMHPGKTVSPMNMSPAVRFMVERG